MPYDFLGAALIPCAPDGACDAPQARAKDKALAHAKREAAKKGLAATGALLSAGRRRGNKR